MNSRTISKDESNILVAIGKLETQMDGLRTDMAGARTEIKEINTSVMARLLNLEGNAVSKLEINPKLDEYETRITNLEGSHIENRSQMKTWSIIIVSAAALFQFLTTIYFHYH